MHGVNLEKFNKTVFNFMVIYIYVIFCIDKCIFFCLKKKTIELAIISNALTNRCSYLFFVLRKVSCEMLILIL